MATTDLPRVILAPDGRRYRIPSEATRDQVERFLSSLEAPQMPAGAVEPECASESVRQPDDAPAATPAPLTDAQARIAARLDSIRELVNGAAGSKLPTADGAAGEAETARGGVEQGAESALPLPVSSASPSVEKQEVEDLARHGKPSRRDTEQSAAPTPELSAGPDLEMRTAIDRVASRLAGAARRDPDLRRMAKVEVSLVVTAGSEQMVARVFQRARARRRAMKSVNQEVSP